MFENKNTFMDSIVFRDKKFSKDYRNNVSSNHSNDTTTTVDDYSDNTSDNNDSNEQ